MQDTVEYGKMRSMRVDGERLKRIRLDRFMNREELAEKSGIHRDHIGRIERGVHEGGSHPKTVRLLAEALGVDPHELLAEE